MFCSRLTSFDLSLELLQTMMKLSRNHSYAVTRHDVSVNKRSANLIAPKCFKDVVIFIVFIYFLNYKHNYFTRLITSDRLVSVRTWHSFSEICSTSVNEWEILHYCETMNDSWQSGSGELPTKFNKYKRIKEREALKEAEQAVNNNGVRRDLLQQTTQQSSFSARWDSSFMYNVQTYSFVNAHSYSLGYG